VLSDKYHALFPVQGLKLSDLLAIKSFESMAKFKYLVLTLAIKVAFVKESQTSLKWTEAFRSASHKIL
jgi:hypothetical protein